MERGLLRGQHPERRPAGDLAPLRHLAAGQVRRRAHAISELKLPPDRGRHRPPRVHHRQRARRGRPHHLRRPGRASSRRRRGALALLPRSSTTDSPIRAQEPDVSVIPLSRPPVDDEIKQAVLAAIDSRQYILGPECREFETRAGALRRRAPLRAHQLRHGRAVAHPARARREGRRRDPGALPHRVSDHRGDLLRGSHAGLRRRRRLLRDGSRRRRRQGDAAHGRADARPPLRAAGRP